MQSRLLLIVVITFCYINLASQWEMNDAEDWKEQKPK